MKALYINSKLVLELVEKEVPQPAQGEVRVKITHFGICGSDLHYYYEGANGAFVVKEPLMPGHELSGTIDLDPSGEFAPGTPVTIHPATFGTSQSGIEIHHICGRVAHILEVHQLGRTLRVGQLNSPSFVRIWSEYFHQICH